MNESTSGRPSRDEAEAAVRTLLSWIGEDPGRAGLKRTPARVVDAYRDWFAGYAQDPQALLSNGYQAVADYKRIVSLCNVEFASHCEHHMAPIIGVAHVAYLPNERLAGISKLVRVVEAVTRRLQVQERMTSEIARCIDTALEPRGVAVIVEAKHQCMTTRGVNKTAIKMVTQEMTGDFLTNNALVDEFMRTIGQAGPNRMTLIVKSHTEAKALEGTELGVSEWMLIDQDRIDRFAAATEDFQWIHVDRERAARELPTGSTIAHGYLLTALFPALLEDIVLFDGERAINYGLNKVRFKHMVPAGSRVRLRTSLKSARMRVGALQIVLESILEIEGVDKPACTAETIALYFLKD